MDETQKSLIDFNRERIQTETERLFQAAALGRGGRYLKTHDNCITISTLPGTDGGKADAPGQLCEAVFSYNEGFSYRKKYSGCHYILRKGESGESSLSRSYLYVYCADIHEGSERSRYWTQFDETHNPTSQPTEELRKFLADIGVRDARENLARYLPKCAEWRWNEMVKYSEWPDNAERDGRGWNSYGSDAIEIGRCCSIIRNGNEPIIELYLRMDYEPLENAMYRFGSCRMLEELQEIRARLEGEAETGEAEDQAAALQSEICVPAFQRIVSEYIGFTYVEKEDDADYLRDSEDFRDGHYLSKKDFSAELNDNWECVVSTGHIDEYCLLHKSKGVMKSQKVTYENIFPYFSALFLPRRGWDENGGGAYRVSVMDGSFHVMRQYLGCGDVEDQEWETLPRAITRLGYDRVKGELTGIAQAVLNGGGLPEQPYFLIKQSTPKWLQQD